MTTKDTRTEEQKAKDAYKKIVDSMDAPLGELKLRGKTYSHISESTLLAATKLVNATREDGLLNTIVAAAAAAMVTRAHPEFLDIPSDDLETTVPRKQRQALVMEGIEATFALALSYIRKGFDGVEDMNDEATRAVRNQKKRIEEIQDSPEWKLVENSDLFATGTLGEVMEKMDKKDKEDDFTPTSDFRYL